MFNSESFPFNQVTQFPVDDFAGTGKGMSSTYRVFWDQCQLDYVENRMKAAHGGGKLEAVCAISNLPDYGERA